MYAEVNLGNGFGQPVTSCRLSSSTYNTSDELIIFKSPGIYDASIPYYFRYEDQTTLTDLTAEAGTRLRLTCAYGSITVPCRLAYGKGFSKVDPTQFSEQTFDGVIHTYRGIGITVTGYLEVRGLSKDDGDNLYQFLCRTVNLNRNPFSIEVLA